MAQAGSPRPGQRTGMESCCPMSSLHPSAITRSYIRVERPMENEGNRGEAVEAVLVQ